MEIALLCVMTFGAAFVQRVSGFGFGIFIMGVLPYLLPSYGEATTLSGLLAMVTSAIITARMWRLVDLRKLLPILFTFIVTSFVAIQFVASAADGLLRVILGVTLIVTSLYFLFVSGHFSVRPSLPVQIVMGVVSGLMGGFFGMQGPPAVLYFLACTDTKDDYMSLAQCYFLSGNVMMTLFRSQSGFLTPAVGHAWLCAIGFVLLGTWVGGKVFDRLPITTLRRVVYAYMAISGCVFLLRSV